MSAGRARPGPAGPLLRRLPPAARDAVKRAADLARRRGVPLALVGGAVRDLLLGRPVRDVDLVVEGNGIEFARRLGSPDREHGRFGTATLALRDGTRLDVATARAENYAHPAALPRVRPGNLEADLARRDFTVNAMALRLAPGRPRLEDPHGGRRDLERGVLRMMHAASPRDDPTRAFRAALYAHRLGFRVEPRTRRWIREALASGAFERASGDRLRREIIRIFSEPGRAEAVEWLGRLGLLPAVHPALRADAGVRSRLRRAEKLAAARSGETGWFAYLLVWAATLAEDEAAALGRRLNLPRSQARALARWPRAVRSALLGGAVLPTPAADDETDEILALSALLPARRSPHPPPEPWIRGRDLVAAGVPPGPAVGRALRAVREALRLGRIGPEEELAWALEAVRREGRA